MPQEKGIKLAADAIDDVLTYALFPQIGLKFLENRGNPAAFEPVPHQPLSVAEAAAGILRPKPILKVQDLCAGYGHVSKGEPRAKVLKNVSFTLERGRNLGVIGESGSGKSTLARAIAGILPPYRGTALFDGTELRPDLRNRPAAASLDSSAGQIADL